MQTRSRMRRRWWRLTGVCLGILFQQGCVLDPDVVLRAGLSVATDAAIFLLENLTAGI